MGAPLLYNRKSFARRTTRSDNRARRRENRACKLDRVLIVVNDKHPKAVETDTVRDGLQDGRGGMHACTGSSTISVMARGSLTMNVAPFPSPPL